MNILVHSFSMNMKVGYTVFRDFAYLQYKYGGHPLQLDAGGEEGLFKELLHCRHLDLCVPCDKQLIEVRRLT